ncbi:flavin reductase family protein [Amycolatopsis australiensis]|uniref:NADH-FMN oxidoreductase RutF, flavin reductase (DIM6/NTAB) family n=1 Tax=Amycolatopsis australiensis TaxID=546364 RepID=A0A1K1S3A4_9PSEU|nr:flavin reductase family protein [Amycolatopsis australiensis]SFW78658.1 NADH-FMN oxidoreductase RutF, flavin reductase (DIM6/NTAB) family [Amycolatopsis australiensis]
MTSAPAAAEVTRHCYARHPAAVAVVAAVVGGTGQAMVCTSLNAVSLSPPIMSVAIRKESTTWPLLRTAETVGVSVLSDLQDDVAFRIARRPAAERLNDIPVVVAADGTAVHVLGAALHYRCRLGTTSEVGDHWLVTLPVLTSTSHDDVNPLVFPIRSRPAG